jgi:hypothetical protein
MILTDKAKEDFLKWFDNEYMELACEYDGYFNMPITSLNALIIEWLDTIDIKIHVYYGIISNSWGFMFNNSTDNFLPSRNEAIRRAILKANEIYNNLNTKQNEK